MTTPPLAHRQRLVEARTFAQQALTAAARFDHVSDPIGMAAVAHLIEQVGEQFVAIRRSDPDFVAADPQIPWRGVQGMRHRLTHEYARADPEVIRGVVEKHLPALMRQIDEVLA